MKSEKLKKLLKKIKKLKKLKKSKKIKKNKSQNLYLSADIETLKNKIKQQDILLSQMKYPYQAPVSSVSYEKLGIGQQNALNQANLENIQKNIEDKIEDKIEDQSQKIETAIRAIKQREIRPQKEGESDKDYAKYVKKSNSNRISYANRVQKKSLETVNKSSGVVNLINKNNSTPQNPIYDKNDNQGGFSKTDFDNSIKTPDSNETFDENFEQINNEIKYSMNQIDNRNDFIDTSTDQSIPVIKSTKPPSKKQPPIVIKDNTGSPLSNRELRQQNKKNKKNKSTVNTTNNQVPVVDISGMNNNIANTEVQINRESERLNNQATNLGLFIPT
jgi:hypothetical protein